MKTYRLEKRKNGIMVVTENKNYFFSGAWSERDELNKALASGNYKLVPTQDEKFFFINFVETVTADVKSPTDVAAQLSDEL
jgi:uncharacterized Fe-S center protein